MPRSNWLYFIAALGLAICNPIEQRCSAQDRPADTNQHPNEEREPINLAPIENKLDGIARAIKSAKDNPEAQTEKKRAADDLKAQQDMANWAFWMLAVGIFDSLLTVAGVFLIWRTLVHTRRAADASKDMVIEAKASTDLAQQTTNHARQALAETDRAWVRIGIEIVSPLEFTKTTIKACVKVYVVNIGKSPATNVTMLSYPELFTDIAEAGTRAMDDARRIAKISPALANTGRVLFPTDEFKQDYELTLAIEVFRDRINELSGTEIPKYTLWPAGLVGLYYLLPGDSRPRYTFIPFEIRISINDHPGFDGSPCVVQPTFLKAVQNIISGQVS